jgi:hypothetical protein
MDVEVDNRDPFETVRFQRMSRAYRHVVEKAETHGAAALRVMAGRAHTTEGIVGCALDHHVGRSHHRTSRAQRRLPGVRAHRGVRIQVNDTVRGNAGFDGIEIVRVVDPDHRLASGERSLALEEMLNDAGGEQVILDCRQPCGALGMMRAHVVEQAIRMAQDRGGHSRRRLLPRSIIIPRRTACP